MTVTAGKTTADSAAGGALTLKAGIGEGNSGSEGGAVSIEGGLGANTGGAVSVTSGVGTADDSGSMTIATADSGSSGVSGDMTLTTGTSTFGATGAFTRWERRASQLAARGCDLPERGGWQHRPRRGGDRDRRQTTTADSAAEARRC